MYSIAPQAVSVHAMCAQQLDGLDRLRENQRVGTAVKGRIKTCDAGGLPCDHIGAVVEQSLDHW
jgi:hypothetical protein